MTERSSSLSCYYLDLGLKENEWVVEWSLERANFIQVFVKQRDKRTGFCSSKTDFCYFTFCLELLKLLAVCLRPFSFSFFTLRDIGIFRLPKRLLVCCVSITMPSFRFLVYVVGLWIKNSPFRAPLSGSLGISSHSVKAQVGLCTSLSAAIYFNPGLEESMSRNCMRELSSNLQFMNNA